MIDLAHKKKLRFLAFLAFGNVYSRADGADGPSLTPAPSKWASLHAHPKAPTTQRCGGHFDVTPEDSLDLNHAAFFVLSLRSFL
jgi:hypothetical protein